MRQIQLLWMGLLLLGAVIAMALAQSVEPVCEAPGMNTSGIPTSILLALPVLIICIELAMLARRLAMLRASRLLPGIYLLAAVFYGGMPFLAGQPTAEYCVVQYRVVSAGVLMIAMGLLEYRHRRTRFVED